MATVSSAHPVRLWPAWVILGLQAATITYSLLAQFDNFTRFVAMMAGPLLCLILFLVYFLGFSRLPMKHRFSLSFISILGAAGVWFVVHSSVHAAMWIYGVPLSLVLATLGLSATVAWPASRRWTLLAVLLVAAWLPFIPLRLDGFDGSYFPEFSSRWSPTPEERLADTRTASPSRDDALTPSFGAGVAADDWPGFRGAKRDSRVRGQRIRADWSKKPPERLWSIPVGPAWSSFAVVGDWLFSQEQFGEDEGVVCYAVDTGKEVWRHVYRARFEEIVAGPGPRATPTFDAGKLNIQGAMGHLICLDAVTGKPLWSQDLLKELDARLPEWGFSASPLVTAGVVIAFADAKDQYGLVAYEADTGKLAWNVPCPGMNFSSAQRMTFGEKDLVVFTAGKEVICLDPADGSIRWRYTPEGWSAAPMIQPQQVDADSLVVALGDGVGTARLQVNTSSEAWTVREQWNARHLKPAFNDFVLCKGFLFGFDQNIFTCVDAKTGQRRWKKGRFGFGQAILFEEQGIVLITAESGEIVLLSCDPEQYKELGRFQAIEGKTWNHSAFARGKLYVRNGSQAACIDLSP